MDFLIKVLLIFSLFKGSFQTFSSSEEENCLSYHNRLRQLHQNTGDLVWDATLASRAQTWADHLADTDTFQHDENRGSAGENLYSYSTSGSEKGNCAAAVLSWYNEFDNYNYATTMSDDGYAIGHFTQVVWKDTTKLGVGRAVKTVDGKTKTYIVARYEPAGNDVTMQVGESYEKARVRVYTDEVQPRKPGAVTPNIFELDPSLCADEPNCAIYQEYGYCTSFAGAMKSMCPITCGFCSAAGDSPMYNRMAFRRRFDNNAYPRRFRNNEFSRFRDYHPRRLFGGGHGAGRRDTPRKQIGGGGRGGRGDTPRRPRYYGVGFGGGRDTPRRRIGGGFGGGGDSPLYGFRG